LRNANISLERTAKISRLITNQSFKCHVAVPELLLLAASQFRVGDREHMVTQQKSAWQTEALAATYLQGVRGAIPAAGLQLELIRKIVESWCPHGVRILDLGCGDGAIGRMLIGHFPNVEVVFADFSETMLKAARDKTLHERRASVIKADFSSPYWLQSIADHKPFDVVVSGFAIHHQLSMGK
jgi:tRNA (cmo5U34)-methyltransferase